MKIVFIINNKRNRLADLPSMLLSYFQQANVGSVELLCTSGKKHAIELATKATEKRCDYLVAVGGDGTLHEVMNGILRSTIEPINYPTLGLLPYGSANDFAKTAHISNSKEKLLKMIQSNSTQKIDIGKIRIHQTGEIRYFINIAGVGLGPEVVLNLEKSSSLFGPAVNYFKNIIKGFLNYAKKEVTCSTSNWKWNGQLLQMAVANGRYFGNGICTAPDARLTNGQFQIAIFADLSIWDYLKNLSKLKKGIKIEHQQVCYYMAKEVILESKEACGIEADGEYVGLIPATVSILPEAIKFLMPLDVS